MWCMKHKMHCINFFCCIWTIDTFLQFLFQFFFNFFNLFLIFSQTLLSTQFQQLIFCVFRRDLNPFFKKVFHFFKWKLRFCNENYVFVIKNYDFSNSFRFFFISKKLRENTKFTQKHNNYAKIQNLRGKKGKTTKSIKYNGSMAFKQNVWMFSFLKMQTLILLQF